MSYNLLLRAVGLSKIYSGTSHPFATLRHALFGSAINTADQYPVLHNISLEIRRGETVGIMGQNGAGKTTLLGILGNVIQPTAGIVERFGRISTLLGLTAGYNPNFTGRENAYLFCSIQGLGRRQADQRMEAIESFADLGRYFELPLRTYSSGMQSRLAFACAVNVDADLIIVDETLAVGDANFRMKCYDRIRQMKREGQSFLLVSHNQNLVANFCTRGIVLENGRKEFDGSTFDAVESYKRIRTIAMGDTELKGKVLNSSTKKTSLNDVVRLEKFRLAERSIDGALFGVISAELTAKTDTENLTVNFGISNQHGIVVCAWDGARAGMRIPQLKSEESREIEMTFRKRLLPGRYFVSCIIHELIGDVTKPQSIYQNFLSFEISGGDAMSGIADLEMDVTMPVQHLKQFTITPGISP